MKYGYKLKILGRPSSEANIKKEKNFYNNIFQDFDWKYIESKRKFDSYYLLNENSLIVSACCTLGFEVLSRNKKIIFLPFRSKRFSDTFGWPYEFDPEGPFWSSNNSKDDFLRIMNYVIKININDWKKIIKPYKHLINLDEDNKVFKKIVSEIIN